MRKPMRVIALCLTAVMLLGGLTGCSGGSVKTPESVPEQSTAEITSAPEKEESTAGTTQGTPVTLRMSWWGGDSRHERILAVIDAFQKANPDIIIEPEYSAFADYRDKFTMQLTSGAAADILAVDQPWVSTIMAQGDFFADLSSYSELGFDEIDPYILDNFCKFDNGIFFMPTGVNGMGSLVDTEMLEQYGLDITNSTFTWDDLITLGEKVHEADQSQYLCCVDSKQAALYYVRTYLRQLTGKQFINDDGTMGVTKEELTQALDFVDSLYGKGIFQPIEESGIYENSMTQNPEWINRKMFMILGRTSAMTDLSARREDESGKYTTTGFVLPQLADGKESGIEVRPTALYAVNKSCENPEAAAKFLTFMFNTEEGIELLKDTYSIPAREKLREYCKDKDILDEAAMQNVEYSLTNSGNVVNAWSNDSEVEAMMTEIIQKIAYKQYKDMGEAADEVISRVQQIVASSTKS